MPIKPFLNIQDRTKQAIGEMRESVRGSFERIAQEMVAWIKVTPKPEGPPRLTGTLADTTEYEAIGDLAFRVVSPCGYSFWVIVGSSRTPANDYLGRAYRAVQDVFGEEPA